jgi:hypothetical protein
MGVLGASRLVHNAYRVAISVGAENLSSGMKLVPLRLARAMPFFAPFAD